MLQETPHQLFEQPTPLNERFFFWRPRFIFFLRTARATSSITRDPHVPVHDPATRERKTTGPTFTPTTLFPQRSFYACPQSPRFLPQDFKSLPPQGHAAVSYINRFSGPSSLPPTMCHSCTHLVEDVYFPFTPRYPPFGYSTSTRPFFLLVRSLFHLVSAFFS